MVAPERRFSSLSLSSKGTKKVISQFNVKTRQGLVLTVASRYRLDQLQRAPKVYPIYSGGFDPLHEGHIACIEEATRRYGHVALIANADEFLVRKRQQSPHMAAPLLPRRTRLSTLAALAGVAFVVEAIDEDQTVCETLKVLADVPWLTLSHFVNGGDRTYGTVPEELICEQLGMEMVWGCGGDMKLQESSVIAERAAAIGALTAYDHTTTRWGSYCTVSEHPGAKQKLLRVRTGTGLSIQTHACRFETWRCLDGAGRLALGLLDTDGKQVFRQDRPAVGSVVELHPGARARIALGQAHAVFAESQLVISETWHGKHLTESDISRYGDPYHRPDDVVLCKDWVQALEGRPSSAIAAE